jgi:hypothetical protein
MHRERGKVVRFIQEWGYCVPPGMEEEHQSWVQANEEALGAAAPRGTRLLGIYSNVFSSEKNAGFYRLFVQLDSYAAMDTLAAAMKDASSDFGRLVREHSRFWDPDYSAPFSNALHKAVVDATIFDPPGT